MHRKLHLHLHVGIDTCVVVLLILSSFCHFIVVHVFCIRGQLSGYVPMYLFVYRSIHLSIDLPMYLSPVDPSTNLPIYRSSYVLILVTEEYETLHSSVSFMDFMDLTGGIWESMKSFVFQTPTPTP